MIIDSLTIHSSRRISDVLLSQTLFVAFKFLFDGLLGNVLASSPMIGRIDRKIGVDSRETLTNNLPGYAGQKVQIIIVVCISLMQFWPYCHEAR